ncbi:MAG: chemoreceptor glutamine deamidase CheD [Nevskiaceae bacterium]|nr:MAG: chemoreceptor glutamine deamidase CheD [Nevskiaceae bacterium]TAM23083.1 MAG: chemoreceptor glutamine deamidase CheD [Nevskiaceae bacterium]
MDDSWASSGAAGDGWASFVYFDRQFEKTGIKLLPGEFYVSAEDVVLTTVLGSCVSACIRDPRLGIGGMNHFMLPDSELGGGNSARYGSYAMEVLVNELLKAGARRSGLEAKVFGGAAVLKSFTDSQVGNRNAQFVLDYLKAEHIPVLAQDLGDTCPRKIFFFPADGRVLVRRLTSNLASRDLAQETAYRSRLVAAPVSGGVELFD